jgi:hypothetical protein
MQRGLGFFGVVTLLLTGIHFAGNRSAPAINSLVTAPTTISLPLGLPHRNDTSCSAFESSPSPEVNGTEQHQASIQKGEIATLIDSFLYGSSMRDHLLPGALPEGIRLMVVTVPDPLHTQLNLQFDRTLEAVQQAAQDERYTYDSSWLPWRSKGADSSGGSGWNNEVNGSAQREACPGVILFRRNMSAAKPDNCRAGPSAIPRPGDAPYQCGMLVFLVAEKPTSGLNRVEWDNTLHWIDNYVNKGRPDKVLRVLGPTFSGSLPSFVRALEDTNMYAGTFNSTLLYSGRIRGCASWQWLKSELNPLPEASPSPTTVKLPVRIADFEENDALQTDRLYRYLEDRGHRLSEVAVLSEDETAYGGLPDASNRATAQDAGAVAGQSCSPDYHGNDRPVHLYYPRDISAIQSAYQEQSIFSASSKTDSSGTPHTVLRPEEDSSTRAETDTVEPFSGRNMALAQEAQLYGIVNTLETHGIRYVVLRSTNSLDYLFLARFLRRAYPTAYIVTMGSDLLFAREVDSTEFRGVVSLSSFPLLPRGQDWTKQLESVPQHAHRVFGSYTMEGDYLAVRYLITDVGVTPAEARSRNDFKHPAKPDMPDYAPPFWDSPSGRSEESEPATWLSVIGKDGYWPLAILKKTSGNSPRFSNLAVVTKNPNQKQTNSTNGQPRELLTLSSSWRFCCVLSLLGFGIHFFACRCGWSRQDLGMFVQFTPWEGRRGPALIAAGWAIICSLLLILFLASCRLYGWLSLMDRGWVWVMGLTTLVACVLTALELRWWNIPTRKRRIDTRDVETRKEETSFKGKLHFSPIWVVLALVVVTLFGFAGWLTFDYSGADSSGVTTAYRSVHLTSGVSPVISLIVMLAGFYWWFWHCLSGLALLGNGRPVLPRLTHLPGGLSQVSDQVDASIQAVALPFPRMNRHTVILYSLPLLLVILLGFVLQRAWMQAFDLVLHSLENTAFNRILHVLLAIALYLILLESAQFYATWLALKRLLLALNRLPLRRTFSALQGLSMRSLWRLSGTSSRARYKVFSHQLESLLHLRNQLEAVESNNPSDLSIRHEVRAAWAYGWHFVQERSKGPDLAMINDGAAHAIRIRFCACAERILGDLIVPEWLAERTSLDLCVKPESKVGEPLALSGNPSVMLGEEFLCMIYVGYLQNLLGRMRTMVLSIAGLFAAIALSVSFYPFTPRPTISLSLLVLLLFIGTVVGIVYAGLDRDSTLSHITNTEPGSLGAHFWIRIVSFVGVPALGLIVSQFPEISDFIFSWVQPTMNAVK